MRLLLTGRHVEITPALRKLVDGKLAKLSRVLNDSIVSAQVVLTHEKYRHIAEISIHARGDHMLHGVGDTTAWETSLGNAVEKIKQQAQTLKSKWQERKRRATPAKALSATTPTAPNARRAGRSPAEIPTQDQQPSRIVRASRYAVKPMTVEEAALAMGGGSETFVVFRNAATDSINVVYRRRDGNLGLIEPEA